MLPTRMPDQMDFNSGSQVRGGGGAGIHAALLAVSQSVSQCVTHHTVASRQRTRLQHRTAADVTAASATFQTQAVCMHI